MLVRIIKYSCVRPNNVPNKPWCQNKMELFVTLKTIIKHAARLSKKETYSVYIFKYQGRKTLFELLNCRLFLCIFVVCI